MDSEEAKRLGLIPMKINADPNYHPGRPFGPFHGPAHMAPKTMRCQGEKDTWYAVTIDNEYRAPKEFAPTDVIIDIGAHIGSFSWFAHYLGSRNIYAFEIDPWHVAAAAVNLGDIVKAGEGELYHAAVVRSDHYRSAQYHYDGAWNSFGQVGVPVDSYSLDQIIEAAQAPIRFIKIDCEGGEWPILYTCTMLDHVQEIAGEFHEIGQQNDKPELAYLPLPFTKEALKTFLESKGFTVEIDAKGDGNIGNFYAKRVGPTARLQKLLEENAPPPAEVPPIMPDHSSPSIPILRDEADVSFWKGSYTDNCFRIGAFQSNDTIVDLGAGIGSFTRLAWERGSRNVIAVEADAASAEIGKANTADCEGVTWQVQRVTALAKSFPIRLLKINIEGDEWALLYAADLSQIEEMCGQLHEPGEGSIKDLRQDTNLPPYTVGNMACFLAERGFKVTLEGPDAGHRVWNFWAKR